MHFTAHLVTKSLTVPTEWSLCWGGRDSALRGRAQVSQSWRGNLKTRGGWGGSAFKEIEERVWESRRAFPLENEQLGKAIPSGVTQTLPPWFLQSVTSQAGSRTGPKHPHRAGSAEIQEARVGE